MTEHWAATSVAACPERVDAGAGSHSQPVWPRTRQRNWSPNRHGAWHRPWGRLGCGRSEKRSRRVARWRLTTSRRPLDGTCDQFLSRGLFRAAANFQKREYAEHEDHRSHNAEQSPTARSQPGHRREVSHWQSTRAREGAFRAFGAQREWRPTGREILQRCRLINS